MWKLWQFLLYEQNIKLVISKQDLIADMIEKLNKINSVFIVSFYSILLDSDNKEII